MPKMMRIELNILEYLIRSTEVSNYLEVPEMEYPTVLIGSILISLEIVIC